ERSGSSDAAIMNPEPNDFAQLFSEYPDLRRVAFNDGKAELLWRRYIAPRPDVPHSSLATGALPSSSGSRVKHVLPFEEKASSFVLRPRDVDGDPVERFLDSRDGFDRVSQCGPLRPRLVHVRAEDRHVVEDRDERRPFLVKRLRRD